MRILALDLGEARVGVALSDPLGMTAQPLEVVERYRLLKRLPELIAEYEVQRIVVGLPLRLDGSKGQAAQAVKAAAKEIEAAVKLPVELWDERLTTAQAQRMLIGADVSRKGRKSNVDKVAAALILQSYLDAKSR
ncbi:MAG: Holliday junction resolvase RuvX [Myxococcota bacterium]|nr:Holliday junction resolvase RuvX [Myxococcota bacterium]